MRCEEVQERLVVALDSGRSDSEVDKHCKQCPSCEEARDGLLTLFGQLDALPKPGSMSGEDFERSLARELREPAGPGWLEIWAGFCGLLARRPSLGFGLAVGCFLVGMAFSRSGNTGAEAVQTRQSLDTLTRQIATLNEAVALVKLEQASASERLQAVHWIGDQGRSDVALVKALGSVLERDENVNVRLAAIDALSGLKAEPEVRLLLIESLKRPQSPLVRIALIEQLVTQSDPVAIALFKSIAEDESSHAAVRERARAAAESAI